MWNTIVKPFKPGERLNLLLWAPPKLPLFRLPKGDSSLYFTHFGLDAELNLLTVSRQINKLPFHVSSWHRLCWRTQENQSRV